MVLGSYSAWGVMSFSHHGGQLVAAQTWHACYDKAGKLKFLHPPSSLQDLQKACSCSYC